MSKYLPVAIGGSIPYDYDNVQLNPSYIYIGQTPIYCNLKTHGIRMNLYSIEEGLSTITIGLADHKGKIIKDSLNKVTLNLRTNEKELVELKFKHKLTLKGGKNYYFLIQGTNLITDFSENDLDTNGSSSLQYPNCGFQVKDLSHSNHIKIPKTYTNLTCPSGSLY